jgi:hypothetical protein
MALMVFVAIEGSLAQEGIKPQRTRSNDRVEEVLFCLTIGTSCVGAMFQRGVQAGSSFSPK